MDIGSKKDARPTNRRESRCCGDTVARRGGSSNAQDGKRRSTYTAPSGRTAVQTPYGDTIRGQKLDRFTEDDRTAPDYRHFRDNLSPKVEAFRSGAVRPARLRQRHRTHGLNT